MTIRREQKEARREEILQAGLEVFVRKGYAAAKISDIAKEAGMSTGLLFHYFESKESLYRELLEMSIAGPAMLMQMPSSDALSFFEMAAAFLLENIKSSTFTAKMFIFATQSYLAGDAPIDTESRKRRSDIFDASVPLIKEGQADGTLREGDPLALAVAFWMSITGVAQMLAAFPDYPCPESDWLVDIIRRKEK